MTTSMLMPRAAVAAVALLVAGGVQATDATLQTTVTSVLVRADALYGGCMAALATSPTTKLAACGTSWVTFDCAGVLPDTDVVRAYRMLDQAQIAYVKAKNVYVQFTDSLMTNGYCFAKRIDLQ